MPLSSLDLVNHESEVKAQKVGSVPQGHRKDEGSPGEARNSVMRVIFALFKKKNRISFLS